MEKHDPKCNQNVNLTQSPILGGTSDQRSAWPNVNLTQKPHLGGTSDQRSAWPEVWPHVPPDPKPNLGGTFKSQPDLTCDQMSNPDIKPLPGGGTSDQRSTWHKVWPKCQSDLKPHPRGVHLTKGQSDPKCDQLSTWPKPHPGGYIWPKVSLTKCQPDLKSHLWGGVHRT